MPDTPKPQMDLSDEGLMVVASEIVETLLDQKPADEDVGFVTDYLRSVRDQAIQRGREQRDLDELMMAIRHIYDRNGTEPEIFLRNVRTELARRDA